MDKSAVIEIYGKLERDPIGGGRPSCILPHIEKGQAKEYISRVHKRGLKFNYLLNATCLGNGEWSTRGQKRIRHFLDWLACAGVDSVTVSIPYLLGVVKKCYPNFKAKVSVCAQVSNLFQAKYWEELGADVISLAPWSLNRDFATLKKIREAVRCGLQIYANTRCLTGCPFVHYHYSSHSHSSRTNDQEFFINYFRLSCDYLVLEQPWRLIAASWIRPEDLHYYEEIGINSVKLSDRSMKSEHIQRIVEAYTRQRYKGNLMDLFISPDKRLAGSRDGAIKKPGVFMPAFKVRSLVLSDKLKEAANNDPTFLDNDKLKDFLKFFIEGRCNRTDCEACGYCREVANRALYIPEAYRHRAMRIYSRSREEIVGGNAFSQNTA
jgi:collagenase-like PrtC family protease